MRKRVRDGAVFAGIIGFVAGNLIAMTVATSRAQIQEQTDLEAYVVNPSGDTMYIGTLAGPTPMEYRLEEGELYIHVYEGLFGCQFDLMHRDRFQETSLNL